jgi:uncharacterized protein YdeI (YjbR/CyaY-like superfamily)
MSEDRRNPKADKSFNRSPKWAAEMRALRDIALSCGLDEDVKWGWPCYAHAGKNVVIIHAFKDYCGLSFFKGALLKDPENILIQPTENMQASRQGRFTSVAEIAKLAATLKAYIHEAIDIEAAGLSVEKKTPTQTPAPEEFRARLASSPELKAAFAGLTPGRQRGYLLFFNGAKQSKTREARIDKHIPRILAGKGIDDP